MNDPKQILDNIYLPREPEYGRWEAIETAPKDGTDVLLAFPKWRKAVIGSYDISERHLNGKLDYRSEGWRGSWWTSFYREGTEPTPTHWMPLPRLP